MTYTQAITSSPVVLVEFFATWCPHCQKMMPVMDEVRELLGDEIPLFQLDIDKNQPDANDVGVDGVPTFIVYQNGKEVWRHSGEIDGNVLLAKAQSYLA